MKTDLIKCVGVFSVINLVQLLSVKVLCVKGMEKKSIISDHTVQVVWQVSQPGLCLAQQIGVDNLNVNVDQVINLLM